MSSLKRMLALFDLFNPNDTVLTVEQMMGRLGYSRGTTYRYIRELHAAGLLSRVASAYALGPRIIELDYNIRQWDPVLRESISVMQDLRDQFGCHVILTNFYENWAVVSHHERGDTPVSIGFVRGKRMPLFRGSATKVIIANLGSVKQRRLFKKHHEEILSSTLPSTWPEFREELARIKKAGQLTSFGEIDPGNVGIAAPVSCNSDFPPGSLCLIFSPARYEVMDKTLLGEILITATRKIDERLQRFQERKAGTEQRSSNGKRAAKA